MGGLESKSKSIVSVGYLMDNVNTNGLANINENDLNIEQVEEQLLTKGIVPEIGCSEDRMRLVHGWTLQPDFWIENHTLFHNSKRVKTWLWVHARYRDQMQEFKLLSSQVSNLSSVASLMRRFTKFTNKIEAHSAFEDQQLFKYFIDQSFSTETIKQLSRQHSDDSKRLDVLKALTKTEFNTSTRDEIVRSIDAYVEDMLAHMQLEEQTIVPIWMTLSKDQYALYRSYLSWKYALLY